MGTVGMHPRLYIPIGPVEIRTQVTRIASCSCYTNHTASMMKHLAAGMALIMLWLFLTPSLAFSHPVRQLLPAATSNVSTPEPECPRKCGNIDIPYPFGLSDNCSWKGEFALTCDYSFNPPKPFAGNIEITSISLEAGEIGVFGLLAYLCNNSSRTTDESSQEFSTSLINLTQTPFLISATRNEFTAIGCNTLALLEGKQDWSYYTGCITYCMSLDEAASDNDNCTGLGCCQTSISGSLDVINVNWGNNDTIKENNNVSWIDRPCSYAFVAEKGWYHFQQKDLIGTGNDSFMSRNGKELDTTIPLVLDWAFRNEDDGVCLLLSSESDIASAKPTAPACASTHSYCVNATQGDGYLCQCSPGYIGNPYVRDGCTNINECELRKLDPAKYEQQYHCDHGSTCHDTQGNYTCKCNFGHRGDGRNGGCHPIFPGYAAAIVATIVAFILVCYIIMELKKRKQKQYFDKNGGEILKSMGINIFTEQQMKRITNGYSTLIGKGAFGKVFMGNIDATQRVAVKCPSMKKGEAIPQEEFVNEITFQFRISHVNLVRLVGCCLETNVPILVFEFVPNGSLYNVLHGADNKVLELSLPSRLDIAIGSAEALSYMHSHGGHNHVHGDVKSANILVGDDFTPKVSDFGSSKLVSLTSKYSRWLVNGDMNYIDSVYLKSGRFTAKSDVYSFSVVLLELITRKTARYGDDNSLPVDFAKCCREEGNGRRMYDGGLFNNHDVQYHCVMECLHRIGALAVRCLKEDMDERPTMAEVAEELKQVKLMACGDPCSVAN